MERLGGRIKGAALGLAAAPLVGLGATVGWAAFALVGSVVGGIALGERGALAGSLVGGVGGALLAGGFAVTVVGEVRGGSGSVRRVLAVLGLAALTGAGTWLSPFVGRADAPGAAAAAMAATLAFAGAALLVPLDEPPPPRFRRSGGEEA